MSRQGARLLQTCCGISHRCKLPHRSSAALPPQAKPVPQRPRTAVAARTLSSFSAFNGTTSSRTGFRTSSRGAPSTCVRSVSTSSTVEDDGHLQQYKDRLRHLGPGRVHLSLDDNTGLATLVLDNHERRNGEQNECASTFLHRIIPHIQMIVRSQLLYQDATERRRIYCIMQSVRKNV